MTDKIKYEIGIGLVVCDRLGNFSNLVKSLETIPNKDKTLFVVSDDSRNSTEEISKILKDSSLEWEHIISGKKQVGATKNLIFKRLLEEESIEHIFVVEDDLVIKDKNVFEEYINLSKVLNTEHLLFTPKDLMDKQQYYIVRYYKDDMDVSVKLDYNCHGVLCYYSRKVLESVKPMDETYENAYEHVDHTYRIFKHFEAEGEFIGSFWYFIDHPKSMDLLGSYVDEGSYIDRVKTRTQMGIPINQARAHAYFKEKHGVYVQNIEDIGIENMVSKLGNNIAKGMSDTEKQKIMVEIEVFNKGKK